MDRPKRYHGLVSWDLFVALGILAATLMSVHNAYAQELRRAAPSALEVLGRLEAAAQKTAVRHVKLVSDINSASSAGDSEWNRVSAELFTDGTRWNVNEMIHGRAAERNQLTGLDVKTMQFQRIWDNQKSYDYQGLPSRDTRGVVRLGKSAKDILRHLAASGYMAPEGFMTGDFDPVWKILRDSPESLVIRDQPETINGGTCFVLEGRTLRGTYTLWVDADHGYNLAQASVRKASGDLVWDQSLPPEPPKQADATNVPDIMYELGYTLRDVKFEQRDGVWIPVEAQTERIMKTTTGSYTRRAFHQRTTYELQFDSVDGKAFAPDFPNGIRVELVNDPIDVSLMWSQGQPVPKINDRVVQAIDAAVNQLRPDSVVPGPITMPSQVAANIEPVPVRQSKPEVAAQSSGRGWALGVGVLAVVALVGGILWIRSNRHSLNGL